MRIHPRILNIFFSGLVLGCFVAGFLATSAVYGLSYSNAINDSSWKAHSSVFSCEIVHEVPYFGEAVFRTRAGEASAFYLRLKSARFAAGKAQVRAKSPVWVAESQQLNLGEVSVKRGTRPMWLSSLMAEKMMAHLNEGFEVEISQAAWFESGETASLAISNIGFRDAYKNYLGCITSLLPANFDQLRRTSLLFPGGEVEELPSNLRNKLDRILKLVKYDNKVRYFFIDGHTDSEGDRDENLELSKVRAELVQDYLVKRGIPTDWITLRWHGERYPTASNATAAGRAKNRRVTVRLERVEEIEVLPLASN